ncbi:MAG: hypothetical protein LBC49_04940 [Bacteroidales bacterium]|jgi:hypothetical protein|nr:hypothetical protein [Bacteroidales bacterium]
MLLNFFKKHFVVLSVIALFIIAKILLFDTYFFWDSISGLSCPALFLYENNFSSLNFPLSVVDDNLCLTSLLAVLWKIFGKNLIVSHVFFMFIGVALIYNLYKLCRFFISDKKILPFIFILVISDAALVTQSLLLMTDAVMLLFAVMSTNYMLRNKRIAFSLSLLGLSLIRARGINLCVGIGFCYFIFLLHNNNWKQPLRVFINAIIPFIPAILAIIGLIAIRSFAYNEFTLSRKDPAWPNALSLVDLKGFAKNVFVMARFFLETGRIFIWITFLFLFIKFRKNFFTNDVSILWLLFAGSLLFLIPVTLFVQNTMGARYFIFQYILISLITGIILFYSLKIKTAQIVSILLIVGLWTGHLWQYPEKISVSWDTTLAHLPYYELRQEMLQYVDEQQLDYSETAFFPAIRKNSEMDLSDDNRTFAYFDLKNNKYIFYSNIGNFPDDIIDSLKTWHLEKEFRKNFIFIKLYKNPLYVTNSNYSGKP